MQKRPNLADGMVRRPSLGRLKDTTQPVHGEVLPGRPRDESPLMSVMGGNSLSMSKRRARPAQPAPRARAFIGGIEWAGLGTDPASEMPVFAGANDVSALRQRFRDEVRAEVTSMLGPIREFDAFDVILVHGLR